MKKSSVSFQPILFFFLALVLFFVVFDGGKTLNYFFNSPPLTPEQKQEAESLRQFRSQSKKDELVLLTGNSFFPPSMRPLAGEPVFLAAGVDPWDGIVDDESGESGDMVDFEIIQGQGRLAFFLDYRPGQPVPVTQTHLQTPARGSYEAFVWLFTEPGSTGEIVVRAKLAPQGERAAFADPQNEVIFHIHPLMVPAGLRVPSISTLAQKSFQADRVPHAEVLEKDLFFYPGGQGVFSSALKGLWFGSDQERIWTDSSGAVQEISPAEEKTQWTESRRRWHSDPSHPPGILTHLEEAGQKWGVLSYSPVKSAEPAAGGFQPADWIFEQYRALMPEAGPEDQVTLSSFQEDPEKPVELQIHRVHRSEPIAASSGAVWGRTMSWNNEVANIHHVYSIIREERHSFQNGSVPIQWVMDELKRAIQLAGQKSGKPCQIFWAKAGCTLRDFDASLEERFHQYGHPPGVVVDSVEASGPIAKAGLKAGDMLVLVDWQKISSVAEAEKVLAGPEPEEGWPLLYWRNGVYFQYWIRIQ